MCRAMSDAKNLQNLFGGLDWPDDFSLFMMYQNLINYAANGGKSSVSRPEALSSPLKPSWVQEQSMYIKVLAV